jgi:hypothetical protein
MSEEKEVKRRGPWKARNRLQELALAGKHFIKAMEDYPKAASAKFDIEQSGDLSALLDCMAEASEVAKNVHKAFEPHYAAMKREAELVRSNAEMNVLLKQMALALETNGHSDKIPAALRSVIQPPKQAVAQHPKPTGTGRGRGRPPKVVEQQQAVA